MFQMSGYHFKGHKKTELCSSACAGVEDENATLSV